MSKFNIFSYLKLFSVFIINDNTISFSKHGLKDGNVGYVGFLLLEARVNIQYNSNYSNPR